jgi:hypothetical protein
MELGKLLRWLFNPWVIVVGIIFGAVLIGIGVLIFWATRSPTPVSGPVSPIMTVIPAATPTLLPPTPTPTSVITPSPPTPPPPPEGMLGVGAYVQVSGTGGDGLRLRQDPGLAGRVLLLAIEAEVFLIEGGPEQVDNYSWWYLIAPYDDTRKGWAVSNYLALVQGP